MSKIEKKDKFYEFIVMIINCSPFLILFFSLLIILSNDFYFFSDDCKYYFISIDFSYLFYAINRYLTWSSRILIDFLTILVLKLSPIIILLLMSLSYTMIAFYMSKIANNFVNMNPKNNVIKNYIICTLLLISFPFSIEQSAGIVATTVNYVWGVFFLLVWLEHIYNKDKNKVSKFKSFMYIICFLLATDSEQITLITFLGFMVYFADCICKRKKVSHEILSYFCILLFKIIIIGLCPGNYNRYDQEIIDWYNEYNKFNIIDKVVMGIQYVMEVLIVNPAILICTNFLLCALAFLKFSKPRERIAFILLLVVYIIISCFNFIFVLNNLFEYGPIYSWINILIVISFAFLMFLIKVDFKEHWLKISLIPILGIISQLLMCFSPTIYASCYRTGTILYFSFMFLGFLSALELKNKLIS